MNIPVAIIALVLIAASKPATEHRPAPMDYRGLALIVPGVALSVFGFQQSAIWGWSNPGTGLAIGAGLVLLVIFYFVELHTPSPLIEMSIFRIRPFLVENLVLGVAMMAFVPVFFFASEYAQISLGKTASQAGLYLLYFFIGFVIASQIGGRLLDRRGAKGPVVVGCALAAVGFDLWAGKVTQLNFGSQQWFVILAGAGMGLMLTPASTDAVNRRFQSLLRRGHRHHPDGQELRRQPGSGHPRHHLGVLIACPDRDVTRGGRGSACTRRAGSTDRLPRTERQRPDHLDPTFRAGRLRLCDSRRALRHGDHHGRGRRRGFRRPQTRGPRGHRRDRTRHRRRVSGSAV